MVGLASCSIERVHIRGRKGLFAVLSFIISGGESSWRPWSGRQIIFIDRGHASFHVWGYFMLSWSLIYCKGCKDKACLWSDQIRQPIYSVLSKVKSWTLASVACYRFCLWWKHNRTENKRVITWERSRNVIEVLQCLYTDGQRLMSHHISNGLMGSKV